MMNFRTVPTRIIAVVLLAFVAGHAAAQQAYPSKPVRFIVPYATGSSLDILARLVGQKLSETLNQQVLVDNRGGGNTIIGSEALVKAAPDGHTIMIVAPAHVIIPSLFATPYDAVRDFAPVATLSRTELVLVLHPSIPANSLQQFIALAKSRPGQLDYGSAGGGTVVHLAVELFNIAAGVKMQHVPYNGAGPLTIALVGGQVQMSLQAPITALPHIKSGKLKAVAVTGKARFAGLPQVPTFVEAGLPGYDVKVWYGVLAPAATPKAILDKLSAELGRIMVMPDFKEKLAGQGMDPFISDPEQFGALIKAELAMWARVIKTANIKMDN